MRVLVVLTWALLGVLSALPAAAEEEAPGPPLFTKPDVDPEVEEVGDEAAEALLDALEAAERTRDEDGILAALKALVGARHEDFVKPLGKLAKHRSEGVREMATIALGSQGPAKKVGPMLYQILKARPNKDSETVMAAAVHSLRRAGFDNARVYEECESLFQKRPSMAVMRACARYFGDLKRKEAVRHLVYWVEPPQPANVNSPTNPPASYWKRLHEIWMDVKLTVLAALKNITGQEFETHQEWHDWLRTPEARRMGLK